MDVPSPTERLCIPLISDDKGRRYTPRPHERMLRRQAMERSLSASHDGARESLIMISESAIISGGHIKFYELSTGDFVRQPSHYLLECTDDETYDGGEAI